MSDGREMQAQRLRDLGYDEDYIQKVLDELEAEMSEDIDDEELNTERFEYGGPEVRRL